MMDQDEGLGTRLIGVAAVIAIILLIILSGVLLL